MSFLTKSFVFSLLSILIIFFSSSCLKQGGGFHFNKENPKFALILSGPVNDSSWNSAAHDGLKRFNVDHKKIEIATVEKVALKDSKEIINSLAKKNFDFIIAHGYEYGSIIKKIAKIYPDVFFCVIGGNVKEGPNVASFNFNDEQYGYLVGASAGLNTSTNKIGIVVGNKIPPIERVIIGMRKGLKSVNPKADLVVSYINSWSDINKGKEAAITQINTGVDVITHIADLAGIGVIKAAEDADISAIGAIQDQHDISPSTVITSGIQDASQLIYLACENYIEGTLQPLMYKFGLKHQVVDLTPSYGNIDPTTENKINGIKRQLRELEIAQYESEGTQQARR